MEIFNKTKPTSKNIIIIDGGNTSMKYLDPNNNENSKNTVEVKSVIEPIYHNVLSLRGDD